MINKFCSHSSICCRLLIILIFFFFQGCIGKNGEKIINDVKNDPFAKKSLLDKHFDNDSKIDIKFVLSKGVSQDTINATLSKAKFLENVIKYDRKQPEFFEDTILTVSPFFKIFCRVFSVPLTKAPMALLPIFV